MPKHTSGTKGNMLILIITVLIILVQTTCGQETYLLALNQNQGHFQNKVDTHDIHLKSSSRNNFTDTYNTAFSTNVVEEEDNNSTIIVVKNTVGERPSELSQTAMDIITIVWYVATFLALAAFFLLMACSDRRCSDAQRNPNNTNSETPLPPPTPSPSYSEFAPPSYDTVIKMQHAAKTSIFVIPFITEDHNKNDNNNNNDGSDTPTTPAINFYTINELQKLGS